jgi:hypothetical protein
MTYCRGKKFEETRCVVTQQDSKRRNHLSVRIQSSVIQQMRLQKCCNGRRPLAPQPCRYWLCVSWTIVTTGLPSCFRHLFHSLCGLSRIGRKIYGAYGRSCDTELMALTEARRICLGLMDGCVGGTQVCRRVRSDTRPATCISFSGAAAGGDGARDETTI